MEQQVSAKVNDGRNRSRSHFKFVFPFGETASIEGVTARFRLASVRVSREKEGMERDIRRGKHLFFFSFFFLVFSFFSSRKEEFRLVKKFYLQGQRKERGLKNISTGSFYGFHVAQNFQLQLLDATKKIYLSKWLYICSQWVSLEKLTNENIRIKRWLLSYNF